MPPLQGEEGLCTPLTLKEEARSLVFCQNPHPGHLYLQVVPWLCANRCGRLPALSGAQGRDGLGSRSRGPVEAALLLDRHSAWCYMGNVSDGVGMLWSLWPGTTGELVRQAQHV